MDGHVRVRIAVAVLADGRWQCAGYQGAGDAQLHADALDFVNNYDGIGERVSFVEAWVPKPVTEAVEGEVVQ